MTREGGRPGALVVVATPIGNLGDLSPRAVDALRTADAIACEDTRRTRKLLSAAGIPARALFAVHEHNEMKSARAVVDMVAAGKRVVLVSDAGTPAVSDPGQHVVAAVADAGLDVVVVPGPSALLAALVSSGLPTDRFVFEGFLPRRGRDRRERLDAIAAEARTVVIYEAPPRVAHTLADLAAACGGERRAAVARELTKMHEETRRGSLAELAAGAEAEEPRGEHVIVVEGRVRHAAVTDDDITAALHAHVAGGEARRDAVAEVARNLGVPKRRVYELSLKLSG